MRCFPSRSFAWCRWALVGLPALIGFTPAALAQQAQVAPASDQQLFLYQGMGANVVCNLVAQGVPFAKAYPAAVAMVSGAITFGHGSEIIQGGKPTKLDAQQLQNGAAIGIAGSVSNSCGKEFKGSDKTDLDKLTAEIKQSIQSAPKP